MNAELLREYCLSLPATGEKMPFDQETLVFTVMDKMFALTNIEKFQSVNLKCDPEEAIRLRETYTAVLPGWHMNKKHWNTIQFDGSIDDAQILEWVKHSYDCVVSSLPKKIQIELLKIKENE
jgi:predicted DNA-binding protein (MmcQ/YjbR family)